MKGDMLNYSQSVMFRGILCTTHKPEFKSFHIQVIKITQLK